MIKSISVVVVLVALLGLACAKPSSFDAQGRRIVNGTATTIETIPFQVSILFFNSQWCGGAILDETTILTASHCFDNYFNNANQLSSWSVRAGSSYWANGGQLVQLQYVVRHAQYNPNTYDFDIAIIKLASALTFNTAVQPVVLAQTDSVLSAGQSIQVSGWGRLTDGGAIPDVLQKIVMPALGRQECVDMFNQINPITERMFCAGDQQGLGDSCNGDSGGPLVDLNNVLYGLVSWGLACAMNGFTGVYTNVPVFIDWIAQNRHYPLIPFNLKNHLQE